MEITAKEYLLFNTTTSSLGTKCHIVTPDGSDKIEYVDVNIFLKLNPTATIKLITSVNICGTLSYVIYVISKDDLEMWRYKPEELN